MVSDADIGRNVTRFRGDMTQQGVAERMRERGWKWSQATVWAVEKGERPLRFSEALDLVDIIGTHLHLLNSNELEAEVEIANRAVSDTHAELVNAIARYDESRLSLRLALLHAANRGRTWPSEAGFEDWLNMTPERVVEELRTSETFTFRADEEYESNV